MADGGPTVGRERGSTAHEIVVAGAAGRMGSRIVACLGDAPDLKLVAALESSSHPALGRDAGEAAGVAHTGVALTADAKAALTRDRILVEFSTPEATLEHLRLVAASGARAVIGTTGFSPAQRDEIKELAARAAILVAPNMSVGVTLALRVLAVMAEALGRDLPGAAVYGRQGMPGERSGKEIGIFSLRSGDVVGEHTVSFGTPGERVELTHRAHSRDTFARGALRAARFVAGRPPGLYSMQEVLGL